MRLLRLLFYVAIGALLAWFATRNWVPVTLRLWPPYELVIRLPVLLLIAFLLGLLPSALVHSTSRWRWRRRLARTERELAATRAPGEAGPTPAVSTEPQAAPTPGPLP